MHKLIGYVCDELSDIERKADKGGKLSMQELQYADTLAHLKKNLMKTEEMSGGDGYSSRGYSRKGMSYDGASYRDPSMDFVRPDGSYRDGHDMSYARGRGAGAKRDSMGRYASEGSLDEHTKEKLREMIDRM